MLLSEHCGIHLDAPYHWDEDGATVDRVPLENLVLPGCLLDFSNKGPREPITVADLEAAEHATGQRIGGGMAIIAWTGVDRDWGQQGFQSERPYVPVESAQWLVERKITLFATDLIGIDDPSQWWWPTHVSSSSKVAFP
jgi:kynurenine formamidase